MDKIVIGDIYCYGDMAPEQNVHVEATYPNGDPYSGVWCNDTEEATWTGVVRELKPWADRCGFEIDELTAV